MPVSLKLTQAQVSLVAMHSDLLSGRTVYLRFRSLTRRIRGRRSVRWNLARITHETYVDFVDSLTKLKILGFY